MKEQVFFCAAHGKNVGERVTITGSSVNQVKGKLRKSFIEGIIIGGGTIWEKHEKGLGWHKSVASWSPRTKTTLKAKHILE